MSTANLTHDSHLHHPGGAEASMAQYAATKTGFFSSFPFGVFAFARLDDQLSSSPHWKNTSNTTPPRDPTSPLPSQPHVELMHTELYSGYIHGPHPTLLAGPPPTHGFEMMTLLFAQQSRGAVTLSSPSPTAKPRIDPQYLSHPLDALVLAQGARFAHEILTSSKALAPHLRGFMPVLEDRCLGLWDGDKDTDLQGWEDYIRAYGGTMHHPAGTCRMGRADRKDKEGVVVDERLRVLGVKGLRIADCSVMPRLNGGHTQMVAYGVGERAAEILIEDWKEREGEGGN